MAKRFKVKQRRIKRKRRLSRAAKNILDMDLLQAGIWSTKQPNEDDIKISYMNQDEYIKSKCRDEFYAEECSTAKGRKKLYSDFISSRETDLKSFIWDVRKTDFTVKFEGDKDEYLTYAFANTKKDFKALNKTDVDLIYNRKLNALYSNRDGEKIHIIYFEGGRLDEGAFQDNLKLYEHIDVQSEFKKIEKFLAQYEVDFDDNKNRSISLGKRINKLKSLFNDQQGTINNLKKTIKELSKQGIQGPIGPIGPEGPKGDPGVVDTDVLTGITNRLTSLEADVALDPVLPSSNEDAKINYYLNRNYDDIVSNRSQLSDLSQGISTNSDGISAIHLSLDDLQLYTANNNSMIYDNHHDISKLHNSLVDVIARLNAAGL